MQLRGEHPPGSKHIIIQVLHKVKSSWELKQEGSPQAANLRNKKKPDHFFTRKDKKEDKTGVDR